MQSAIVSFNKSCKLFKAQSSLNNPLTEEEEEHHKEHSDVLFYHTQLLFSEVQVTTHLSWPVTEPGYYFHCSEILIPPPKI